MERKDVAVGGLRYRGTVSPLGSIGSGVIEFLRLVEIPGFDRLTASTKYPRLVARRVGTSENFVWAAPSRKFSAAPAVGTPVVFADES